MHLLIALAAGVMFVTSVLPINMFVLLAWAGVALSTITTSRARYRAVSFLTQVFVFSATTIAAFLAPVKTTQSHFTERVQLPNAKLTVADIEAMARNTTEDYLPVVLSMNCDQAAQTAQVLFPDTSLSLGEFIHAIEDQTSLRHRFAQCGNAYTILWGYPPSYYLGFSDKHGKAN